VRAIWYNHLDLADYTMAFSLVADIVTHHGNDM